MKKNVIIISVIVCILIILTSIGIYIKLKRSENTQATEKSIVEIYNLNGQLVKSFEINGVQNVNVSDLVKGTYVVKTSSNGKTVTQKVIKK